MRYKIFNGEPREFHAWDTITPLNYAGEIVVAIDPSKTNCAMVIGDPGGQVISIVEMSGNNWKQGPVQDTTEYCADIKSFVDKYIGDTPVLRIGLEQAITKKGMMHHQSSMVLTEVRGALLNLFYEKYRMHKEDVEVNNWTWKHAILPEGYRSQSEKGSVRYFWQYLNDPTYLSYFEDDVTDALCIYKYLILGTKDTYTIACQKTEKPLKKFQFSIMPDWADGLELRKFEYNPSFSVKDNAIYFANRSTTGGIAKIDVSRLSIEDIYENANGFDNMPETGEVRLVVIL